MNEKSPLKRWENTWENGCEEIQLEKAISWSWNDHSEVFWKIALKKLNISICTGWSRCNYSDVLINWCTSTFELVNCSSSFFKKNFCGFCLDFNQFAILLRKWQGTYFPEYGSMATSVKSFPNFLNTNFFRAIFQEFFFSGLPFIANTSSLRIDKC